MLSLSIGSDDDTRARWDGDCLRRAGRVVDGRLRSLLSVLLLEASKTLVHCGETRLPPIFRLLSRLMLGWLSLLACLLLLSSVATALPPLVARGRVLAPYLEVLCHVDTNRSANQKAKLCVEKRVNERVE